MQKGECCTCRQNEYLFYGTAIFTLFWVICCKIHCVLVLNTLRFGAKCTAFWCKMECDLMLNAVRFGAKRNVKWC